MRNISDGRLQEMLDDIVDDDLELGPLDIRDIRRALRELIERRNKHCICAVCGKNTQAPPE